MACRREDDDAELDDRELPDEADMDPDEDEETQPCPYCGKPVYEQAQVCPHCRSYIALDEAPGRKPLWLIVAVIVCVLIVLLIWVF